MSFIRSKEIPPRSGNWYDYEVKTVHENGKVRQKVIRYIGKSGTSHSSGLAGASRVDNPATISQFPAIPLADDAKIHKMKTPSRQIASALGMYYGGMSLDAIQQQFRQDYDIDMSESNYWNWVKRFTQEAINQYKDFKHGVGDHWVADETYMKMGKRNVYFWDMIDVDTNYLIATHVSFTMGSRDARVLMHKAKDRAGKYPKVVITDKLKSYIAGVGDEYEQKTVRRRGGPFAFANSGESTAELERFHRTLEQRTEVFRQHRQ